MKRMLVLGVVVGAGALAVAVAGLQAQARAGGQGRGGGRGPQGPPVAEIQKVAENLFMVTGGGGNTAAYIAANGVVLVDTKLANWGPAIMDKVKTVTDKPVTHIVNTHTHGDHTGSNQYFPASVEIVTHANTKTNMEKMEVFQQAENKQGLPDRTFTDRMTMLSGNDAIDLYHFGATHTSGDTLVVFRNLGVMHTGDMFPNKGQPFIDRANGGSGVAYGETIGKAASGIPNVRTIINGHNATTMVWQDFVDYGEFNRLFLAHARASMKAGRTPEEAMKTLSLPAKFSGYNLQGGRGGAAGNFGVLYEELGQ
jgi:glyoxylase-like metal-dependent hydrolase (beta-lactamase superfamily II)